jgi:hypothetical protein
MSDIEVGQARGVVSGTKINRNNFFESRDLEEIASFRENVVLLNSLYRKIHRN